MHHVKIKTERPGESPPPPNKLFNSKILTRPVAGVVTNCFYIGNNFCFSADLEGTGARSRLDAVLQGLVERSENERSVK